MQALLKAFIGVLGGWLALTAWILDFPATDDRLVATALGLVLIGIAVATTRWPGALGCRLLGLIGCASVAGGVAGVLGGPSARLNEVVIGLMVVLLGFMAGEISRPVSIKAVDKDGNSLAEISTITRKGDVVTMKAQLLGAMPATIYVAPEELWKIVGLMSADTAFALPRLLLVGWLRVRRQARSGHASQASDGR
jgi:hypothetical protein